MKRSGPIVAGIVLLVSVALAACTTPAANSPRASQHTTTSAQAAKPSPRSTITQAAICAAEPADPSAIAVVVVGGESSSSATPLSAVALPSGRTLWTETLPGDGVISAVGAATGSRVVYAIVSKSESAISQNTELLVAVDAASGRERVVTSFQEDAGLYARALAVSPDGRYVLVSQSGSGDIGLPGPLGYGITEIDLQHPKTSFEFAVAGPWGIAFISPTIAYASYAGGVELLNVTTHKELTDGSLPRQEAGGGVLPGAMAVSPTGASVAVLSHGADLFFPAATVSVVSEPSGRYSGYVGLSTHMGGFGLSFDCTGRYVYAVTDLGVVRADLTTKTSMTVKLPWIGDLDAVDRVPGGTSMWLAYSEFTSSSSETTVFLRLTDGSRASVEKVGNLPGYAEAMALASAT
ncbi:MAG TPA: hypothetical protein VGS21_01710 [Acidimicrobiales bacterium]|nr:hypothetical protein [Acidimicrobiales bacterium]